eukprot:14244066-Ditylum_brightwellii.AAC.1
MKRPRAASESGKLYFRLSNVTPGNRHGAKVFHVKDRRRRIGESAASFLPTLYNHWKHPKRFYWSILADGLKLISTDP